MKACTDQRVLVAVPTLGQRPKLLMRTLASLRDQPGVHLDIVIVTPHVLPEVADAAREHGAQVLIAAGHISAAVNRAFATARPEHQYAAWIGDDDMAVPGAISRAVSALQRAPSAVMCFGDCEFVDVAGRTLFVRRPPPAAALLMHFVPGLIKSEACLFRLSSLRAVGGLDESLRYAMDLDLILRLRRIGPMLRSSGPSGRFCLHGGSITTRHRAASFQEAQGVQHRAAGPWLRPVVRLMQPALMRLFMAAARRMEGRVSAPG